MALLADAEQEGLNPSDYLPASLGALVDDASGAARNNASLARLDIGVTAMALRFAEHIYSGRIVPKRLSGYYDIVPPVLNLGQALSQLSARSDPDRYLSSLAPSHPAYSAMKASLAAFEKESVQREQEPIPAGERVKLGGQDARVSLVRARIVELGYLPENDAALIAEPAAYSLHTGKGVATLDEPLSKALKAFQANHGIKQTGAIDKATVAALNSRPERDNAEKLVLNMERMRWLPRDLGKRHVLVNQASFELRLIDGGDITWSTKVIVGTPETQTAVFSDEMETVVINPYWGVPQSIIRYEMMPRLARDRRYLDRLGYQVVNEKRARRQLQIRQLVGLQRRHPLWRAPAARRRQCAREESSSCSRTRMTSTCTTLRPRSSLPNLSAPSAMAACAWRARANSPGMCWAGSAAASTRRSPPTRPGDPAQ